MFNRKRNFTHLRILHRRYSHRVTIFVSGTRSYDDFYEEKGQTCDHNSSTRNFHMKTTLVHCAGVFYNCLAWRNRHKKGTWWRHMTFGQCPTLRYIERDSKSPFQKISHKFTYPTVKKLPGKFSKFPIKKETWEILIWGNRWLLTQVSKYT